jgi:hypothetical protein
MGRGERLDLRLNAELREAMAQAIRLRSMTSRLQSYPEECMWAIALFQHIPNFESFLCNFFRLRPSNERDVELPPYRLLDRIGL